MLVFDTYKFYQQLEQVGFTKEQAEKVTNLVKETQRASFEEISNNLATKTEIGEVKAELELKITEVKVDLIKWIVTLLLAQTGILAALVKLL